MKIIKYFGSTYLIFNKFQSLIVKENTICIIENIQYLNYYVIKNTTIKYFFTKENNP